MKKIFLIILVFAGTTLAKAQDLNSYKYIIVPQEFNFSKEQDQYQLNSLTKFLFEKEGFEVFFEGEELPEEFAKKPCEALVADVENHSGLFRTRVSIKLKDCYNRQVFTSEEGVSRKKDFKDAYHEALRNAFQSVQDLNYSYDETIVTGRPELATETEKLNTNKEETKTTEKTTPNPGSVKPAEEIVQNKNSSDSEMVFGRDNSRFLLKKTAKGYSFYQEGMEEPFAALVRSTSGENFIYSAINSQGMAHFDEEGNLIVEILNSETGNIDSVVYKLQP